MNPIVVIGHPGHRRVADFCRAAGQLGLPPPHLLAHHELIEAPRRLLELDEAPRLVRIDSFGEDAEVDRALLKLGYEHAVNAGSWALDPEALEAYVPLHGEVVAPRQAYFGLKRHLARLQAVFEQRPSWRILQPTASIARLFDKQACWRLHHRAGLSVPEAAHEIESPEDLRLEAKLRGWRSVYVKLRSGSSASCLALYEPAKGLLRTSLARDGERWVNVLGLRSYRGAQADAVLGFIIREGAHVENGLPKAQRDGRVFDLRVLVVDGEPAFVVERQSHHPVTNLHLGGRRGDAEQVRARMGGAAWGALLETARRTAALHDCFHLGVDLAVLRGFRHHAVLEANAFGDLLPRLERDGLDAYGWQLDRLVRDNRLADHATKDSGLASAPEPE